MYQLQIKRFNKNNNKNNQRQINKNKIKDKYKDYKNLIIFFKDKLKTNLQLSNNEIKLLIVIKERYTN